MLMNANTILITSCQFSRPLSVKIIEIFTLLVQLFIRAPDPASHEVAYPWLINSDLSECFPSWPIQCAMYLKGFVYHLPRLSGIWGQFIDKLFWSLIVANMIILPMTVSSNILTFTYSFFSMRSPINSSISPCLVCVSMHLSTICCSGGSKEVYYELFSNLWNLHSIHFF